MTRSPVLGCSERETLACALCIPPRYKPMYIAKMVLNVDVCDTGKSRDQVSCLSSLWAVCSSTLIPSKTDDLQSAIWPQGGMMRGGPAQADGTAEPCAHAFAGLQLEVACCVTINNRSLGNKHPGPDRLKEQPNMPWQRPHLSLCSRKASRSDNITTVSS